MESGAIRPAALAAVAALLLILWQASRSSQDANGESDATDPGVLGNLQDLIQSDVSDDDMTNGTVRAFLDTIRYGEGTADAGGYSRIVGGGSFADFSDHPRRAVYLPKYGIYSTAAGAYQIIVPTWDRIKAKLGLTDFTPASQDRAALELIREKGAIEDVRAGNFETAVAKVRKVWASMPGAGYGQAEIAMAKYKAIYAQNLAAQGMA